VPDVYGAEDESSCERCALSRDPAWPLAPKDRVFELLGWNRQPNIRLQPAAGAITVRRG
jgi:hypothetical protein